MSVGPRDNLTMRKSDEHTKAPSYFANTKVYSVLHFLVVIRKSETANKKWVERVS